MKSNIYILTLFIVMLASGCSQKPNPYSFEPPIKTEAECLAQNTDCIKYIWDDIGNNHPICIGDVSLNSKLTKPDPKNKNQCCPDPNKDATYDADCKAPPPVKVEVGKECMSDSDCGEGTCITDSSFKRGYCSTDCSTIPELCPQTTATGSTTASTCTTVSVATQSQQLCMKNCAASSECRDGYQCYKSVCVPGCSSDHQCPIGEKCVAGLGNNIDGCKPVKNIGDPCEQDSDCEGIDHDATCLIYDQTQTPPKGICSKVCNLVGECNDQKNKLLSPGSTYRCSYPPDDPNDRYCLPSCDTDNQPDDTICQEINPDLKCKPTQDNFISGGFTFECRPPIVFDSKKIGGACVDDAACGGNLTCDTYSNGGMCVFSALDCLNIDDCPSGSTCKGNICMKSCQIADDCNRDPSDNYTCDNGVCRSIPDPAAIDSIAKTCTDDNACGSGQRCDKEVFTTRSTTGYCTTTACNAANAFNQPGAAPDACPAGTVCYPTNTTVGAICLVQCDQTLPYLGDLYCQEMLKDPKGQCERGVCTFR